MVASGNLGIISKCTLVSAKTLSSRDGTIHMFDLCGFWWQCLQKGRHLLVGSFDGGPDVSDLK